MEAKAILRHFRQSPRKVRIELDVIRGKSVGTVLNNLHFSKSKASSSIEKIIQSAVSNYRNKSENTSIDLNSLKIKECFADGGAHIKRFRAASMGRISRLNKPTSHITVIISDNQS